VDNDEILDGLALWDEHKPQSGEDWVAVAERFIADGCTTEKSSPLFAGLVLAVRQRDAALAFRETNLPNEATE
jgi:hypothetical protein